MMTITRASDNTMAEHCPNQEGLDWPVEARRMVDMLGDIPYDKYERYSFVCSAMLHVQKLCERVGRSDRICSWSTDIVVVTARAVAGDMRWIHLARVNSNSDAIVKLATAEQFSESVPWWISKRANGAYWLEDLNFDIDYVWKYAVDRLKEVCVDRRRVMELDYISIDLHKHVIPEHLKHRLRQSYELSWTDYNTMKGKNADDILAWFQEIATEDKYNEDLIFDSCEDLKQNQ